MNHRLTKVREEFDFHKKAYSKEKFQQLQELIKSMEEVKYDNNMLKMSLEQKCDQDQMDFAINKFKKYCTMAKIE